MANERVFFGASALVFGASAAATILWCGSMSGGMAMPGGWTMSMTWMRMPGQTWVEAAASFFGMWVVMMAAMMLPSLAPLLWRYRQAAARSGAARLGRLTALVSAGYFLVWTAWAVVAFPVGAALTAAEMRVPALARAVPAAVGALLVIAGLLQRTAWKARQLDGCQRLARMRRVPADLASAWRYGLRSGLRCSRCCASLTAVLLVIGVMNLEAMAAVTAAITAERLAPAGARVARAIGALLIGGGLLAIARAAGGA